MKTLLVICLLLLAACTPPDVCNSPCPPDEPQCIQVCVGDDYTPPTSKPGDRP